MGKKLISAMMAVVLAVGMCPAAALADGPETGGSLAVAFVVATQAQNVPNALSVQAKKAAGKAKKSKYTITTKRYKVTIPKAWRGKVEWKTVKHRYSPKPGKWKTSPITTIYLKGHKGDDNYRLAMVSGALANEPGPGGDISSLIAVKASKGNANDMRSARAYVMCPNMVYRAYYWNQYHSGQMISDADLAKMIKITTNGKVSLAKARANGNYTAPHNKYFKKPGKYLTKIFKGKLKCK